MTFPYLLLNTRIERPEDRSPELQQQLEELDKHCIRCGEVTLHLVLPDHCCTLCFHTKNYHGCSEADLVEWQHVMASLGITEFILESRSVWQDLWIEAFSQSVLPISILCDLYSPHKLDRTVGTIYYWRGHKND